MKAVGTLTPIKTAYEDIGLQLMDMLIKNNDKLIESFHADNLKADIELLELDDRLDAIVEMYPIRIIPSGTGRIKRCIWLMDSKEINFNCVPLL